MPASIFYSYLLVALSLAPLLMADSIIHPRYQENIVEEPITSTSEISIEIKTERTDRWVDKKDKDDEIEQIIPGVLITNHHYLVKHGEHRAFILFYGAHSKQYRRLKVLYTEQFTFSLEAKSSFHHEGKAFENRYDRLRNRIDASRYGYPYRGYIFFILDPLDRVVWSQASFSRASDHAAFFMSLEVDKGFTKEGKKDRVLK